MSWLQREGKVWRQMFGLEPVETLPLNRTDRSLRHIFREGCRDYNRSLINGALFVLKAVVAVLILLLSIVALIAFSGIATAFGLGAPLLAFYSFLRGGGQE